MMRERTTSPAAAAIGSDAANLIHGTLDYRLDFPDEAGELGRLDANIARLDKLQLDPAGLAVETETMAAHLAKSVQREHVRQHVSMLVGFRKVAVPEKNEDEGADPAWQAIQPSQTETLSSALEDVSASIELTPAYPDALGITPTPESYEAAAGLLFMKRLRKEVGELHEAIPTPFPQQAHRRVHWLLSLRSGTPDTTYKPYPLKEFGLEINQQVARKISQRARKLNETIDSMFEGAERFLAQLLVESNRDTISEYAARAVLRTIIWQNELLLETAGSTKSVKVRPDKPAEEQPAPYKPVPPAEETARPQPPQPEATDNEPVIQQLGEYPISVPWLDDGKPVARPFKRLQVGGQSILIVNAMGRKLEAISIRSRDKLQIPQHGIHPFDVIIQHHAKRMASGVLPYQNNNSVKRMFGNDHVQEYAGMSIWYSYYVGNNTQRVYFTLKEAKDVLTTPIAGVKPGELCMLVLAETDKRQQIETMKIFTGQSTRFLRVNGAGSI